MPDDEEDKLIARMYTEHWKSLHSSNPKDRDEVISWVKKKKLRLLADALRNDETPRALGARAILDFIANLGKR